MRSVRHAVQARPVAWLLALLLLAAQALGLWHAVAHVGHGAGPSLQAQAAPESFGHAVDDEAGCRLYDQIATAAALPSVAPGWLADPVPAAVDTWSVASTPVRALRPYQARAPPRG